MKHPARYLPALLLTAAVCLGAVFLPARLAACWDEQRWFHSLYSADVAQSNVSYSYALTTSERIALITEFMELEASGLVDQQNSPLNVIPNINPSENEIQMEQVLSILAEEMKELVRLGLLPEQNWDAVSAPYQLDLEYVRLMDWEDPQKKLSLWSISLSLDWVSADTKATHAEYFGCLMDAETGKLYFVSYSYSSSDLTTESGSLSDPFYEALEPSRWADYLDLTEPVVSPWEPVASEDNAQIQQLSFDQEDPAFQYCAYYFSCSQKQWFRVVYTPLSLWN